MSLSQALGLTLTEMTAAFEQQLGMLAPVADEDEDADHPPIAGQMA